LIRTRTIGRTGLRVSELGFGCGGSAGLMVAGEPDARRAAVATALELGITYFDTAPIYGDTLSETHLGQALRDLGAKPVVATKVALELDELDDIPAAVIRSVEASLERLGLESVPLVHLHNRVGSRRAAKPDIGVGALLTVDDVLGPNGVVSAFETLRRRGLVQFIGCCSYGGETTALDALVASGKFDSMLVNYSLLNQTAFLGAVPGSSIYDYREIAARAVARGMGTCVLRVLESGAVAGGDCHPVARVSPTPAHLANVERARALGFLQAPDEGNLVPAALRFALANPGVSIVLVGFSDADQVRAAVAAASKGPLAPDELERIERVRQADFATSR
jgi:aryl-alcohol dehydrogenase-like predicted oxidoreductase